MWFGMVVASVTVFALLLIWTAIDRRYGGTPPVEDSDGSCASGHRCFFCSCGRPRSTAESANGGHG